MGKVDVVIRLSSKKHSARLLGQVTDDSVLANI